MSVLRGYVESVRSAGVLNRQDLLIKRIERVRHTLAPFPY